MDGHTLSVFVSVYETGSISKTAVADDLNQSSVSHAIAKMRAAVGDPLFVNPGHGIVTTETASNLVPRAEQLVAKPQGLAIPEQYNSTKDSKTCALGS